VNAPTEALAKLTVKGLVKLCTRVLREGLFGVLVPGDLRASPHRHVWDSTAGREVDPPTSRTDGYELPLGYRCVYTRVALECGL
jgi:hypothetical protein